MHRPVILCKHFGIIIESDIERLKNEINSGMVGNSPIPILQCQKNVNQAILHKKGRVQSRVVRTLALYKKLH